MDANRVRLKIFASAVLAVIGVEALTGVIEPNPTDRLAVVGITRLIQCGLILFIVVRWGSGWGSLGLGRITNLRGLKKGAAWSAEFGCAALISGLIFFLAGGNPVSYISSKMPVGFTPIACMFLVGGVVGPVAEEIFFRGICYGYFRRWGAFVAISLSTAIFVMPHTTASGIPVAQIIGGVVFAVAYEVEKSLLTPIVIHVSGNLAIFAVSLWLS